MTGPLESFTSTTPDVTPGTTPVRRNGRRNGRRRFLQATACAIASVPIAVAYARMWEPHWLEIVRHRLAIAHLPSAWRGRTIVQLSDLHVGSTDEGYLHSVVETVNSLNADLVVITGDVIDHHFADSRQAVSRILSRLSPGRFGTLACLGNHDYGRRWRQTRVADHLAVTIRQTGIVLLRNEQIELEGLHVFGIDEFLSPNFQDGDVLQNALATEPSLCLCHNPDVADRPVWGDFQGVVLAGHTHGGQCKPPFLPPPKNPVRNPRYVSGFYDIGPGRELYINRGIGYGLKVRFNCRPEVTVFELV